MNQQNRFISEIERERSYRKESEQQREKVDQERIQHYFSLIDELSEYMKAEGILRLPVRTSIRGLEKAHCTIDGRIIATYKKGRWPFSKRETRQYHLRDLSEVLEFLYGVAVSHQDQLSEHDMKGIENLIDDSVKLNLPS